MPTHRPPKAVSDTQPYEASESDPSTELLGKLALASRRNKPTSTNNATVTSRIAKDTLQSKASIRRLLLFLIHCGNFTLGLLVCGHVSNAVSSAASHTLSARGGEPLSGTNDWTGSVDEVTLRHARFRDSDVDVQGLWKTQILKLKCSSNFI